MPQVADRKLHNHCWGPLHPRVQPYCARVAQRTHDLDLLHERVGYSLVHRPVLGQQLHRALLEAPKRTLVHGTVGPTAELCPNCNITFRNRIVSRTREFPNL